jgi:hypothetical protein
VPHPRKGHCTASVDGLRLRECKGHLCRLNERPVNLWEGNAA